MRIELLAFWSQLETKQMVHRKGPVQGRNEWGKGGTISRAPITMGAPNHCGGRGKPQKCHKYFLQYSAFASEKTSSSNMGAPNLLLAAGVI